MLTSARGFTLIEMMVSMVVGLILVGSVVALTTSSIQSNAQNIASTRLNQELRAVTGVIIKDLQRARYQRDAVKVIGAGNPAPASLKNYNTITVTDSDASTNDSDGVAATTDGDCVRYAYQDAQGPNGGGGADDGRGIWIGPDPLNNTRRAVFIGTNNTPLNPPACGNRNGIRLSSPEVDITLLSFNYNPTNDAMLVTVEGQLANDNTVKRRNTDMVRIPTPALP